MDRRQLLGMGLSAGALVSARTGLAGDTDFSHTGSYARAFDPLDRFVAQYLREMNAPGLILCLADAGGVQRVRAYGLDNLELKTPLNVERLFQIGSISKSFLALCLMQLQDEGKLDLHRPVQSYLPWLPFANTERPLTTHDLLTHAGALPDGPLFLPDPAFRYQPTAAPGTFFHYCNMGFEALGHLLASIDGRTLAESFRARILRPLGMSVTEPIITLDSFERMATSYQPRYSDRPFPRRGALSPSPPIAMSAASGCIASTARDMGAYLQLLIHRGAGSSGPIVSPQAFDLFSHPHIPAEEFGPGASYGYGIAVDRLEGHTRLRHTGGMVSFASALQVDLDAGIGAFASINAMQGYRPDPVTEYALRLMRACGDGTALPGVPAQNPAWRVHAAQRYAGHYQAEAGRALDVTAEGDRLYLEHRGARVPLEPARDPDNSFVALHPDYADFALLFGRSGGGSDEGAFDQVGWGSEWFAAPGHVGSQTSTPPPDWLACEGHYRNEDPWIGSARIVARGAKLWLNGVVPLEPGPDGRYYLRDEPHSPEWIGFSEIVNGRAMRMVLSGAELRRA